MSKAEAHLDAWMKELGPSDELRQWFGHRADRWDVFQERYRRELSAPLRHLFLTLLQSAAHTSAITLLYGARDSHQNEAVVLREYVLHHRPAPDPQPDETLVVLAAVTAVAAAQPSGDAALSRLMPFVASVFPASQLEAALQILKEDGDLQESQGAWRITGRGQRLLRAVPNVPAE
jgi:uncharacterized protein YeaO (DUF488 family)